MRGPSLKLLTSGAAAAVAIAFSLLLLDIAVEGTEGLFATAKQRTTTTDDGGVLAALVSTVSIGALALATSLPVALGCTWLGVETFAARPRFGTALRRSLDVASATPSIAVGLVGWTLFSNMFGLGFSLLAGALTLSLMIAPLMASAFLAGLDALPAALRAQSLGLGVSRWDTFWRLLLPSCRPAIAVGVVLALGRATAETACLVLTSGISTRWPEGMGDPGATLAVHVYHLARNVPDGEPRAYSAALLLVLVNAIVQLALARLRLGGRR
ncbi:MAG: ABC transporter permease subunit [Planctomycetota bacterium]